MTQYMLSVWHGAEDEVYSSDAEMQEAFEAVDAFNKKITERGKWVFGGGLMPVDTATVVRLPDANGEVLLTDGPFAEAKEHLGGFWVLELNDLDEALAYAKEASVACKNPVEVRPFQSE